MAQSGQLPAKQQARQSAYPSQHDWEKHKDLIIELYTKYGIPRTAAEMRRSHGFNATAHMYKNHIHKKWKANTKHNNVTDMMAMTFIARLRAQKGIESLFELRGRYIDNNEIQRYWRRRHTSALTAASSIDYVPYPRGLKVMEPMQMEKHLSAPGDFTTTEKIFWNIRKFSGTFEGFEDVHGLMRPNDYPRTYWQFQTTWETQSTALDLQQSFDPGSILNGASEWLLVHLVCKFFYRYRDSTELLSKLQSFLQLLLEDPRESNDSLRGFLQGLTRCEPSQLTVVAERVMSIYLESLSSLLDPLHWLVKQMAMDWAATTADGAATRRILDMTERLTKPPRTMAQDWQLMYGYWQIQEWDKAEYYCFELVQHGNVPFDYIEVVSPFLHGIALYSKLCWGRQLRVPSASGWTPTALAERTTALLALCCVRKYGPDHILTMINFSHLAEWNSAVSVDDLKCFSNDDIHDEFCRIREGYIEITPLMIK